MAEGRCCEGGQEVKMPDTEYWHGDVTEVHMCQLAALENAADHQILIKFTDDEAGALETRALTLALELSVLDAEQRRALVEEVHPLPTEPLARKEAARLMAELPAHAVLPLDKLGGVPLAGSVSKKKSRGLLPRLLSRKTSSPPVSGGKGGGDAAARVEAAGADLEEHRMVRALAASRTEAQKAAAQSAKKDDAQLAAALKESQRQVEVEKALVDVKVLKRDMEGEYKRLADKQGSAEKEALATRGGPAGADAQAALEKVKHQRAAVRGVLAELANVDSFLKAEPLAGNAPALLAGDVVRRCVQYLASQGFQVSAPPARKDLVTPESAVAKFRTQYPETFTVPGIDQPPSPPTPPLSPMPSLPSAKSPHAERQKAAAARSDADTDADADALLVAVGGSAAVAAAAADPPRAIAPIPFTSPSAEAFKHKAAPRVVVPPTPAVPPVVAGGSGVSGARVRRARRTGSGGLEASTNNNGIQQVPQVEMLLKDLQASVPLEELRADYAAPNAGQVATLPIVALPRSASSITPEERQAAAIDADTHARMLQRLGGEVRDFMARSNQATIGELVEFVGGVEARLSALEGPVDAVLAHFSEWPAAEWAAMKESADVYRELTALGRQEQSWILRRGDFRDEGKRIETFYDTLRARVAELEKKQARDREAGAGRRYPLGSLCVPECTLLLPQPHPPVPLPGADRGGPAGEERGAAARALPGPACVRCPLRPQDPLLRGGSRLRLLRSVREGPPHGQVLPPRLVLRVASGGF
eukprot:jgi/Botrbrau1/14197/Bobra.0291s0003.2